MKICGQIGHCQIVEIKGRCIGVFTDPSDPIEPAPCCSTGVQIGEPLRGLTLPRHAQVASLDWHMSRYHNRSQCEPTGWMERVVSVAPATFSAQRSIHSEGPAT